MKNTHTYLHSHSNLLYTPTHTRTPTLTHTHTHTHLLFTHKPAIHTHTHTLTCHSHSNLLYTHTSDSDIQYTNTPPLTLIKYLPTQTARARYSYLKNCIRHCKSFFFIKIHYQGCNVKGTDKLTLGSNPLLISYIFSTYNCLT